MTVIWGERLDNRTAIETGIRRLIATVAPGPRLSAARRAADRITRRPAEPLRIASLAQAVGLGETSLRRHFKSEYGITLRAYHQRVRVRHVLTRIMETSSKLSSIGQEAGYASEGHFHRAVRQCTGTTVGALRRLPRETLVMITASLVPRPRMQSASDDAGRTSARTLTSERRR